MIDSRRGEKTERDNNRERVRDGEGGEKTNKGRERERRKDK